MGDSAEEERRRDGIAPTAGLMGEPPSLKLLRLSPLLLLLLVFASATDSSRSDAPDATKAWSETAGEKRRAGALNRLTLLDPAERGRGERL